jgi:hypothetical protein
MSPASDTHPRRGSVSPTWSGSRPHRLVAQDTALSRRRRQFESGWGYTVPRSSNWQSVRLLTGRFLVRVQARELTPPVHAVAERVSPAAPLRFPRRRPAARASHDDQRTPDPPTGPPVHGRMVLIVEPAVPVLLPEKTHRRERGDGNGQPGDTVEDDVEHGA